MQLPQPNTSMSSNHGGLHSLHDPHAYSNSSLPHPPSHVPQSQSQTGHNGPQRTLHHARSQPHLQHTASSDSASAYELYGSHPGAPNQSGGGNGGGGGGGNYTHVREVSNGSQYGQGMDPRQNGVNGGYQTPMHSGNNGGGSQAGSLQNTPHAHQQQHQHLPMYGNDEQYAGR